MAYFPYKIDLITDIFAQGQIIYRIRTYPDAHDIPILFIVESARLSPPCIVI